MKKLLPLFFAGSLVILDLATKALTFMMETAVIIPNFLTFIYFENTGAGFGIFAGMANSALWLGVFNLAVVIVLIAVYLGKKDWQKSSFFCVAFAFILAGAFGNMVDRFLLEFVRDFIHIHWFDFIFNLADLWVTVGTILMVIFILFLSDRALDKRAERKDRRERVNEAG